jgi:thiamine biosynthesis lipoprotein
MTVFSARRIRPWLGTYVYADVEAASPQIAAAAIEAAFSVIAGIHRAMSFHSAESDLASLHRGAHIAPTQVSAHTFTVLGHALALAEASDGIFDPTVAPSLVRHGALPTPAGPNPGDDGSWQDIHLHDSGQVSFDCPLWLDLGGIAKGYAVDCAVEAMQQLGALRGSVNAGGDLRSFGTNPEGFPVAVRNPANPAEQIPLGRIQNKAIATSGDYFLGRSSGANWLSPIVDPSRGTRPALCRSVTVVAGKCVLADGLTKIVSLLGRESQTLLERFSACAAIIEPPEKLHVSRGFWEAVGHGTLAGEPIHA